MNNSIICIIEIKGRESLGNKFAKKLSLKDNLSKIREIIGNQITNNIIFTLSDDTIINKEDEKNFFLADIIDGKIVHMKNIETKKKSKYELFINGNYGNYKLNALQVKLEKLNNIRNLINDIITEEGIFLTKDGIEILKNDENNFTLEEIIDGNRINIKVPEESNENNNTTHNEFKENNKTTKNEFKEIKPTNGFKEKNKTTFNEFNQKNIMLPPAKLKIKDNYINYEINENNDKIPNHIKKIL